MLIAGYYDHGNWFAAIVAIYVGIVTVATLITSVLQVIVSIITVNRV